MKTSRKVAKTQSKKVNFFFASLPFAPCVSLLPTTTNLLL
jgi:hypothetical protein